MKTIAAVLALTTAASLAAMPAHATSEGAHGKDVFERAAAGDLAIAGGARRTAGDRSEAYRTLLDASTARNVILLMICPHRVDRLVC